MRRRVETASKPLFGAKYARAETASQQETAVILQGMTASTLRDAAKREHAAALEEYCTTMADIARALGENAAPTAELLEHAQTAKLRLENARTLLQLSVDAAVSGNSVQRYRRRRHIH
jgi:hypothetical protein